VLPQANPTIRLTQSGPGFSAPANNPAKDGEIKMYLLVFLFRMLLGRDDAGSWCLQLLRRDGRSENRSWSGLFFGQFAARWAWPEMHSRSRPLRRLGQKRYGGRDVDRGQRLRERFAPFRRSRW
jgi:hypothetical protein